MVLTVGDVAKYRLQYIDCVSFYVSSDARPTPNPMPIFSKLRCHLDLPGSTPPETAIKPQEYCAKPKTFCAKTRCFYGDSAPVLRAIHTCCALTPGIFAGREARWQFHRRGSRHTPASILCSDFSTLSRRENTSAISDDLILIRTSRGREK